MNPIQNRSDQNHTQSTGKLQSHPEAWTELHTITRAATTRAATVRAATGQRTWHSNATKVMTALAVLMVAGITAVVALLPVAVFELASSLIRKSPLEPWLVNLPGDRGALAGPWSKPMNHADVRLADAPSIPPTSDANASPDRPCPTCGTMGHAVSTTVLAHLHSRAISEYQLGRQHHSCPNQTCRTVHHAPLQMFTLEDVAFRVYGKEDGPDINVCACYSYIRGYLKQHGWKVHSELETRIGRGAYWCDLSNVNGQPCLEAVRLELLRRHLPSRQVVLDNPSQHVTAEESNDAKPD